MKRFFTILGIVAMGATAYGQEDTDIVDIPDMYFKTILVREKKLDTNGDGQISYGEARAQRGWLSIELRTTSAEHVRSAKGIEAFTNLTHLILEDTKITSLDLSKNTALRYIYCNNNIHLTSLDISKNTELESLGCGRTSLTNLDISNNTKLRFLNCSESKLTSLDIRNNTLLKDLYCENNQIQSLDLSNNTVLRTLSCSDNKLTNLDVSKNTALRHIYCSNNQITSLDVSKNKSLENLSCDNNQLTQLNLANGMRGLIAKMRAENNPPLTCIQIDDNFTPWSSWWKKDNHARYSDNCNYNLSTTEINAENTLQILNPIKDHLIIKTNARIEKVEIYNTAGQLTKVLANGNTQVQDLAKGIYLIKISTDKGLITEKIIKN